MLEKDRRKPVRRRAAPKAAPKPATAGTPEIPKAAPVAPTVAAAPAAKAAPVTTQPPAAPATAPRTMTAGVAVEPARAVSATERQRMVAEAAYYRATRRGFAPGDPVRDWIEAEAEIDAQLLGRS